MDPYSPPRGFAALVVAFAIVLLVVFARGEPDRATRPAAHTVMVNQSI